MMEFGKSLRAAREAKGLTIAQIAESTRLLSAIVEGLENEDFSRIAAPIYGRSFVRLYCEAVGLEPKPFVDEFMDILNGNREPAIKERPAASEPSVKTELPPEAEPPVADPLQTTIPSRAPEPDLFRSDPLPPPTPAPEPDQPQTLSRYAAPVRERPLTSGLATLNLRIVVLTALLTALLVAAIFGIRALYRMTAETPAASAPTAASPAPRAQQQDIPSLYID